MSIHRDKGSWKYICNKFSCYKVTTFGESHGGGVGCVIDGCPSRLPLSEADIQVDLDRRYSVLYICGPCVIQYRASIDNQVLNMELTLFLL